MKKRNSAYSHLPEPDIGDVGSLGTAEFIQCCKCKKLKKSHMKELKTNNHYCIACFTTFIDRSWDKL